MVRPLVPSQKSDTDPTVVIRIHTCLEEAENERMHLMYVIFILLFISGLPTSLASGRS